MKHAKFLTARPAGGRLALGLLALLCLPAAAAGQEAESLERIRQAAEAHALAQLQGSRLLDVSARAAALDSRLRLARCDRTLETRSNAPNGGAGRLTVLVRCPGSKPWTLYVPVTIDAQAEVASARRQLARGELLLPGDLQILRRPVSELPDGWFGAVADLAGKEVKRPVQAGSVLTRHMVAEPLKVRRGQEVVILGRGPGLEVRMRGEALRNAGQGELVQVRNKHSGRTVQARVIGEGMVQVVL